MLKVLSNYRLVGTLSKNLRCISSLNLPNLRNDIVSNQHKRSNLKSGCSIQFIRLKYDKKGSRKAEESDDEDDFSDTEFKDDRDSKIIKSRVNSLRADLLLKAGLGMARNKVELVFYENRIRVNGEKLQKKSSHLSIGDEIDVIRGFSSQNPSLLTVSRVEILAATEKEENIAVQLRRYKTLLIENYKGSNAYKSSQSQE
ncbi:C6orf203 family protein [Megaselia abdita]